MRVLQKYFPVVFLTAGAVIFTWIWGFQIFTANTWKNSFNAVSNIGTNCAYAPISIPESEEFAVLPLSEIRRLAPTLKPLEIPYRGKPNPPKVAIGEALYVRCQFDSSSTPAGTAAWLSIGPIFGASQAFLNNRKIANSVEPSALRIPMTEADFISDSTLEIISLRDGSASIPGNASLVPIFTTSDVSVLTHIDHLLGFWKIDRPILGLGFALALLLGFGSCWILGIRYADVGWIIVVTGTIAVTNFINYGPLIPQSTFGSFAGATLEFATIVALGAFLLSYFRIASRIPAAIEISFIAITAAYSLIIFNADAQTIVKYQLMSGSKSAIGALIFLVAGRLGVKKAAELPAKRGKQVRFLSLGAFAAALCYAIESITLMKYNIGFASYLNIGFTSLFSMYLHADLAIFHHSFFQERTKREIEEKQKELLQERLKLGQTVQDLLLPANAIFEWAGYTFLHRIDPASYMSGDWIKIYKPSKQECLFFFGDVVGKGPQAALAVATIVSYLDSHFPKNADPELLLHGLNAHLLSLFRGHMTTTAGVIHARQNGTVTLYSCGSTGFFTSSKQSGRMINLPSTPLGINDTLIIAKETSPLEPKSVLVSLSDGIIESSRGLKRAFIRIQALTAENVHPAQSIADEFSLTENRSTIDDDRTIICLERSA